MDQRGRRVSKVEFLRLMLLLRSADLERYRQLRDLGWSLAVPLISEHPN
jgi:hypothetical protein